SLIVNESEHFAFRNTRFQTHWGHDSENTSLSSDRSQSMSSSEEITPDFPSPMRALKREISSSEFTFPNLPLLDLKNPENNNAIGGIDDFKNPVFADVSLSGNYKIDSLLYGWKFPGSTITYSFDSGYPGVSSEIDITTKNEIRYILENVIEPLINIDFQEVFEAAGDEGQIQYVYADIEAAGLTLIGDPMTVTLNENFYAYTQAQAGNAQYEVILHETLHALGLKHPGNYNGDEIGGQQSPFLPEHEDHTTNTVMSYHNGGFINAITPMGYDVMALRYLYGTKSVNMGNSIYEFERPDAYSLNGQFFGGSPSISGEPLSVWQTLTDNGGTDTLNLQQLASKDYFIDINTDGTGIVVEQSQRNAGTYTHLVNGQQYSFNGASTSISNSTWIENVTGSGGNDEIIGNSTDNTLHGGNGNDELTGNYGFDLLVGEGGDDILRGSTPSASIYDGDEVDTLFGGPGSDTFVIGDPGGKVYYTGVVRYASIMDFNQGEEGQNDKDLIQLSGSAKDYLFDETWPGGVGIFYQAGGPPDDLVAIVIGVNSLDIQTDVVFV
ncbi:MAG: hypothetical protein AAFX57_15190, partial [Bacteroidota bacterium]